MRGGDDIDNEEVTIIADNGAYVGLGILTQDGREYWHIRTIPDALEGGTTPDAQPIRIPKSDVTILRGYQWDVLLDHHNKTALVLEWRANRAQAVVSITADITSSIQDEIDAAVTTWEKENPMPGNGYTKLEVAAPNELEVLESAQETTEKPNDEEATITQHIEEWNALCHSLFAALECALPTGHEELHTADPNNEGAPTWDDEAQTGVMPF